MQAKTFQEDLCEHHVSFERFLLNQKPYVGAEVLCTPSIIPRTAPVTGNEAGLTHPNDGSLLAMPETPVKNDQLQGISWGSVSVKDSSHEGSQSWNGVKASSYACPSIPRDSDTFPGLDLPGPMSYGHGEQDHRLVRGPCTGTMISLDSFLPVPKDDDAFLGLGGPGFAPHGDRQQSHTLTGGLEAEQWPYRHHVPVGCMPACRSSPRRKRRRFTNGEKAVINHKRKVGVCRDCRQAKRKVNLRITSAFFC